MERCELGCACSYTRHPQVEQFSLTSHLWFEVSKADNAGRHCEAVLCFVVWGLGVLWAPPGLSIPNLIPAAACAQVSEKIGEIPFSADSQVSIWQQKYPLLEEFSKSVLSSGVSLRSWGKVEGPMELLRTGLSAPAEVVSSQQILHSRHKIGKKNTEMVSKCSSRLWSILTHLEFCKSSIIHKILGEDYLPKNYLEMGKYFSREWLGYINLIIFIFSGLCEV